MHSNFEEMNRIQNQNFQAIYEMYDEESKKYINTKDVLEQENQKLVAISNEIERIQSGIDSLEEEESLDNYRGYIIDCSRDLKHLKNDIRREKVSVDHFLEDPSIKKFSGVNFF